MEFSKERARDLLAMCLGHGGDASPSHPAIAVAKDDGYVISHLADVGGMCEVWSAFDGISGRRVAIKCVISDSMKAAFAESLIRHEADAMADLEGVAGISMIRVGGSGAATYLVLPWIDGEAIDRAVASRPAEAERWIRAALKRLASIHEARWAHGDLKPEHVIVTDFGVVLLDFGVACRQDEAKRFTLAPKVVGLTREFAPPEGVPTGTRVADAYAMGRVLERLLPHLDGPVAAAVRRVVSLSGELRNDTDGGALLACYEGTMRRRRRVVRSVVLAVASSVIVVATLGAAVAMLGQWPEVFAMAVPGVVVERAPEPLSPWSAAVVELSQTPEARTVLHRPSAIAIRATPPNDAGEIAWLLHNNQVEVWSPVEGARVVTLPEPGMAFCLAWDESGGLLVGTQAGVLWDVAGDTPRLLARLDRPATEVIAAGGGVEAWSHEARSIVRVKPEGVEMVWPGPALAAPLGGSDPGWVVIDAESRAVLDPSRDGDGLKHGESVTAAYSNEAGDVALGLSSGDLMWSRGGGAWQRHRMRTPRPVRAVCLTPDSRTALVGDPAHGVLAFDIERREVMASPEATRSGLIWALDLDPMSGVLTVVTTFGAEAWHLRPQQTSQATR